MENSENKVVGLTIRVPEVTSQRFKDLSSGNNLSQTDFFVKMVDQFYHFDETEKVQPVEEDGNIRILLCRKTYGNSKESKNYEFKGVLKYASQPRPVYFFSQDKIKNEYGIDCMDSDVSTNFHCFIYQKKNSTHKYLVYYVLTAFSKSKNIRTLCLAKACFADTLIEIHNHLVGYASAAESDVIDFTLADVISDDELVDF